jgi:hypothetical protein
MYVSHALQWLSLSKALKKLGRVAIWKLEQADDSFAIVMDIL